MVLVWIKWFCEFLRTNCKKTVRLVVKTENRFKMFISK
jgi:hypothetical protein